MSKTPGSNKRQRPLILTARVSPQEKEIVTQKAEAYGGVSAMFRVAMLNAKPRPSPIDKEAYAQLLGVIGNLKSEMNKIGSNLNQLAHYANMGKTLEGSIDAAIKELEGPIEREFWEMRTLLMKALGAERTR